MQHVKNKKYSTSYTLDMVHCLQSGMCIFPFKSQICKYTCKQQQTRTYHNDHGELPKEMGRCVVFPHNQEVCILPAQKLYANINRANTQYMCYYWTQMNPLALSTVYFNSHGHTPKFLWITEKIMSIQSYMTSEHWNSNFKYIVLLSKWPKCLD